MDRLLSEQDVLDAICKVCVVEVKSSECRYGKGLFGGCAKYEAIKAIPSADEDEWVKRADVLRVVDKRVNKMLAEPKTGYWIERRSRATGHIESVCSECGAEEGYPYNDYCGNCGTRTGEQVKQMALDIIDRYRRCEVSE